MVIETLPQFIGLILLTCGTGCIGRAFQMWVNS